MSIPLAQLETWSGQGAIKTSKDTYATVNAALEDANAKYTDRNFKIFLQGSYGNDTNIYAESDVDVVTGRCFWSAWYKNFRSQWRYMVEGGSVASISFL